jgi:hypothetical protein
MNVMDILVDIGQKRILESGLVYIMNFYKILNITVTDICSFFLN